MVPRVLHILSQRPARTGSGITLLALCEHAAAAGWVQAAAIGVPADDPAPPLPGIEPRAVHPLTFRAGSRGGALDFPVPGMSDVMPYASSVFRELDEEQLEAYRRAWRAHLTRLLEQFRPDLVHAHHVWLVSALARELAPELPLVIHGHGTGLRQLELCPQLAAEVIAGCGGADRLALLHGLHARRYAEVLGVDAAHLRVVGAGYRQDLFHARGRARGARGLLYAGKLSRSKGLPWLLEAFERLRARDPELVLRIAGGGAGAEAEGLRARLEATPGVELLGVLDQPALAAEMRRAAVFVLPSLYEGLPLVLVEALAAGCRLVATALPGILDSLAGPLGEHLTLVPMPALAGVDELAEGAGPGFADGLEQALAQTLERSPLERPPTQALAPFSWSAVAGRVQTLWRELLGA